MFGIQIDSPVSSVHPNVGAVFIVILGIDLGRWERRSVRTPRGGRRWLRQLRGAVRSQTCRDATSGDWRISHSAPARPNQPGSNSPIPARHNLPLRIHSSSRRRSRLCKSVRIRKGNASGNLPFSSAATRTALWSRCWSSRPWLCSGGCGRKRQVS
jgi:hypothetical protein